MAKISRCQLVDVISNLSDIRPLNADGYNSTEPDDLFLCALGFEPRCLRLPDQLKAAGYRAHRAIYFKYATNLDDNAANLPVLEHHLGEIAPKVGSMESDESNFSNQLRSLLDIVVGEAKSRSPRVTMDISVTANRLLLRCIKVLLEYDLSLRLVYSEADVYYPTKEEYAGESARWEDEGQLGLEQGVSDVLPSTDHPGAALDLLPDAVILFPTFKGARSKAVISFVDPSLLTRPGEKVVWLLGIPHLDADRWRLEAMNKINAINLDAPHHEVSTFDYKDTLRILEQIYSDMSQKHTITLSPLGSKMQALGTAIFCYMHPDVRIVFAVPQEYNAVQYSKGCKAVWQVQFGPIKALRHNLDKVGKLRVVERGAGE